MRSSLQNLVLITADDEPEKFEYSAFCRAEPSRLICCRLLPIACVCVVLLRCEAEGVRSSLTIELALVRSSSARARSESLARTLLQRI